MNKRITAGITAFILSFSAVPSLQAAEDAPALDEKIISQLTDENKDGKKDITDLSLSRSLYFKLKDIDDISFLKYADSCEYLSLVDGSIKDFSVIKEMKSISSVQMRNITPENLSFLENQNIRYFNAEDGELSIEERAKYLRAEDITIPAGMVSVISLYPINMFEGKLVIKDTDIAAFGEYGDMQEFDYMNAIIYAKKTGETECSLVVDDTTVKTFKIKVTEPNFVDFSASPDSEKTLSINKYYYSQKYTTFIHNSDGSLWTYDSGKYSLFGTDVKEYKCVDSVNGSVIYTLTNDGKIYADGKPVVGIFKPVKSIYCNEYGVYGMTEDNDLWFTGYENGRMDTELLCENCTFFDLKSEFYSGQDLNCFRVTHLKSQKTGYYTTQKYGIGKHEMKKIVVVSDKLAYMTDNEGMLWKITINSLNIPTAVQITKEVSDIWISYPLAQYQNGYISSKYLVAAFSDLKGKKYLVNSNDSATEIEEPDKYGFVDNTDELYTVPERDLDFLHYNYYDGKPSLFEGKMLDNDFMHMIVRKDQDKSAFISFCGYYLSARNIEKVCGAETDGEDYILLLLSTNGALWEYHIASQKFVIREFAKNPQTPTAAPSPTAVPTKTPTAAPTPTAVPTKTPTAAPSPTAVPTKTPTAAPTPTAVPTKTPTAAPTPTAVPTKTPTAAPTPTAVPTKTPTAVPSPTAVPTKTPTAAPTAVPTKAPTAVPTAKPVYTAANYVSAAAYMNGAKTEISSDFDINKDGKINIIDIILLKELILKTK